MADKDPCANLPLWSALQSAVPDLTLAGVLAGFLIVVVAALVVQWYDRASPRMIALFASGVAPLTLSSFLFTISSGATPPEDPNVLSYCNIVWSQWLPAFTMLLIGGSVLLCGMGWALIIYSSHLADKLNEKKFPTRMIEDNTRFFIYLSALLSLAGTTAMTALLIIVNVTYLQATTDLNTTNSNKTLTYSEFLGVKWYAMFFVFLFGVYAMVRCAYLVTWRTNSFAKREHVAGVNTKSSARRGAWDNKRVRRVAKEIGIAVAIALGAELAIYSTKAVLGKDFSGHPTSYVMVVVVAYIIARLAYYVIVHVARQCSRSMRGGQATTKGYAEAGPKIHIAPSVEKREDAFQYSAGRLITTSYNIVFFAVLGTVFCAALSQEYLGITGWRTNATLFIGGLYPSAILLGLSYSVPAAEGIRLPEWKTWPGLRLLP
jgi:hypothetical protein